MSVTRLIYFSENLIDASRGSMVVQLGEILAASTRNNKALDLTGALVFDDQWFLQTLEGERGRVWSTLKRIEEDERHSNVVIVEAGIVPARLFGNWWMALAKRDASTEHDFAPFLVGGRFVPSAMSAQAILDLMVRLARPSLSRKLAAA